MKTSPIGFERRNPFGAREIEETSKPIVLRAAYYLGECFARLPGHAWSTGNTEYMGSNMPVVTGFLHDDELPPLAVCDNLLPRAPGDGAPEQAILTMVETWKEMSPSAT